MNEQMTIQDFHDCSIHTKLTIIYELLVCEVIPSLHGGTWRNDGEE